MWLVYVGSPAGACIRHGRSGHSSDATPSDYFGFVPRLSPFLFIPLSIALPHDLYISYSFAPYEEMGIYAYPSVSTLRWTAAVCCRTDHRWEIPVPWQQTHICSIVSPSRALCGSDHAPSHERAAHRRAYIDGVDIFIILTTALKYVNPLYFLESTSYKNEQSLASNMASAGKTVAIDQQLARLICSSDVSACA